MTRPHLNGTQFIETFPINYKEAGGYGHIDVPPGTVCTVSTSRGVIPWKGDQVRVALSFGYLDKKGLHVSPAGHLNRQVWLHELPEHTTLVCMVREMDILTIQARLDDAVGMPNYVVYFYAENGNVLDDLGEFLFGPTEWANADKLVAAHTACAAIVNAMGA